MRCVIKSQHPTTIGVASRATLNDRAKKSTDVLEAAKNTWKGKKLYFAVYHKPEKVPYCYRWCVILILP
jgi:hypothetical protein